MSQVLTEWVEIKPYGADSYTHWISGIYKITSYREDEYLVFFIQNGEKNWGDHPSNPPNNGKHGKCWNSLDKAKQACVDHVQKYTPTPATMKRAHEIRCALIEKAKEYA